MVGLLDPLEVKGIAFKNRIVMPPMKTGLATIEGLVTENLIEHYVQRSKALGMVIIEHSYVSIAGKISERQLGMYDDNLIQGLQKLSSSIHDTGTPVVIQINHARTAYMKIRDEGIEDLALAFARAAERAAKAGFDGVEVHGAHGFLLNQFFSPLTNKRRDKYGGSLENRMRFPLMVVEMIKEKISRRLLLYRLGAEDMDPNGIQIEDSRRFAVRLEEAGVDIIDVSGGLCGSEPAQFQGMQGYFILQAKKIKDIVSLPIIGGGGITEPKYANKLVKEEKVDLVYVGRALLKDPDWATKAIKLLKTSCK